MNVRNFHANLALVGFIWHVNQVYLAMYVVFSVVLYYITENCWITSA